jgi:hypothetical protein
VASLAAVLEGFHVCEMLPQGTAGHAVNEVGSLSAYEEGRAEHWLQGLYTHIPRGQAWVSRGRLSWALDLWAGGDDSSYRKYEMAD